MGLSKYAFTTGAAALLGAVLAVEEVRAFINSLFVGNEWCEARDNVCFGEFYIASFIYIFALALAIDTLRNKGWFKAKIDYLTQHNRSAIHLYVEEDSTSLFLKNDEWRGPFINIREIAVHDRQNRTGFLFRAAGFHLRWRSFIELPFLIPSGAQFSIWDVCESDQELRGYGRYQFHISLVYSFKNVSG